jgi:hypothetical protein
MNNSSLKMIYSYQEKKWMAALFKFKIKAKQTRKPLLQLVGHPESVGLMLENFVSIVT